MKFYKKKKLNNKEQIDLISTQFSIKLPNVIKVCMKQHERQCICNNKSSLMTPLFIRTFIFYEVKSK